MGTHLASITLRTSQLPNMLNFYRTVGILFSQTQVDKGTEVYRGLVAGLEFSLYGAANVKSVQSPELQLSFAVQNLEIVFQKLKTIPGAQAILDPSPMADGKKAIVIDPDGHAVELKEVK